LAALKRLDIIIDGQNGFAFIRPKTTAALPYQHNLLGADFVPKNSESDDLVADGSPAYKAGIRDGDILLKVCKLDFTKWRANKNPLPDHVGQPGTKLRLTLKRGDKIFKTTATLRNIIPPDAPKNSN
jgi:S1-C subfamily serine protease